MTLLLDNDDVRQVLRMRVRDLAEIAPTGARLEAFSAEHGATPAESARDAIEGADVVALATNAGERGLGRELPTEWFTQREKP